MKFTLVMLSLLFLAVSCGDQPTDTSDSGKPGDEQAFSPITVEPGDRGRLLILSVCSALEEKQNALDDYIMHRTELPVTYSESDCEGRMPNAKNLNVRVIANSNRHEFVSDSAFFGLPEVETLNSGVMKEICSAINLPNLQVPMQTANRTAIDFRVVETSYCHTDSQHVCVQVKKGPLSIDGTKFRLSQITLVSFETVRGNRPGFYTYKNEKSFGSCGNNRYRTKIATFN